jgi:hypothetical protein
LALENRRHALIDSSFRCPRANMLLFDWLFVFREPGRTNIVADYDVLDSRSQSLRDKEQGNQKSRGSIF